MFGDYRLYREVLSRVTRPIFSITNQLHPETAASDISLESYMAYGLGSGINGRLVFEVPCSNAVNRGSGSDCINNGLLACSQCCLVKYCSERCQRQHWPKHRLDCEHPYLNPAWEPEWMLHKREPLFADSRFLPPSSSSDAYKNPGYPAYDCLRLQYNEREAALDKDLKICMAAAGDIHNLVELVNSLPDEYAGKLDILLNNSHAVVLNRMLVILCVLLTPGPSIDESAEVAMHLMCSAFLPDSAAAYMRHCVDLIYGKDFNERDMSFQTTLKTRGRGKLYSAQPSASIKKPLELFSSTYGIQKAHRSMQNAFQDPFFTDDRHKTLCMLRPAHRLALERFWKTGILVPFPLDTTPFKSPNRLMYTPQGDWIGLSSNVNPLHGWDMSAVRRTGLQHGVDPSGDILGALFFHIKSELREFCLRIKEYNISIHLLQYDSRLISKGISIGVLPAFSEASFDRIDVGDLGDQIGVAECLGDWGPLLNKKNKHACLVMHSKKWHENSPHRIARNNPRAGKILMERCQSQPHLKSRLKTFFKNPHSPSVARLMASLDAFVDHEEAFLDYLEAQEAQATAASLGLTLREVHSVHPKRVGVPLWAERQILPNLSKDDFYDLFTLGGADLTLRFAEFECSSFLA